jgi:hypothetical protein
LLEILFGRCGEQHKEKRKIYCPVAAQDDSYNCIA